MRPDIEVHLSHGAALCMVSKAVPANPEALCETMNWGPSGLVCKHARLLRPVSAQRSPEGGSADVATHVVPVERWRREWKRSRCGLRIGSKDNDRAACFLFCDIFWPQLLRIGSKDNQNKAYYITIPSILIIFWGGL